MLPLHRAPDCSDLGASTLLIRLCWLAILTSIIPIQHTQDLLVGVWGQMWKVAIDMFVCFKAIVVANFIKQQRLLHLGRSLVKFFLSDGHNGHDMLMLWYAVASSSHQQRWMMKLVRNSALVKARFIDQPFTSYTEFQRWTALSVYSVSVYLILWHYMVLLVR